MSFPALASGVDSPVLIRSLLDAREGAGNLA